MHREPASCAGVLQAQHREPRGELRTRSPVDWASASAQGARGEARIFDRLAKFQRGGGGGGRAHASYAPYRPGRNNVGG